VQASLLNLGVVEYLGHAGGYASGMRSAISGEIAARSFNTRSSATLHTSSGLVACVTLSVSAGKTSFLSARLGFGSYTGVPSVLQRCEQPERLVEVPVIRDPLQQLGQDQVANGHGLIAEQGIEAVGLRRDGSPGSSQSRRWSPPKSCV
jgi:hypothetical protein